MAARSAKTRLKGGERYFTFIVDEKILRKFSDLAAGQDRSASALLRVLMHQFIDGVESER